MTNQKASFDELPVDRVMTACVVRVVDDDESMLASYRFMLGAAGWKVMSYHGAADFLENPGKEPGCLVLDVRMPEMSGLQLQAEMKRRGITLPVIFVTGHGDVDMAVQTMKDGAGDFMLKPVVPERLKDAVLHWCRADCQNRQAALQKSALESDVHSLSAREREVVLLVAEGLSNKDIAEKLSIAERTVKFHRSSAAEKLGVTRSAQLIALIAQLREKGLL